MISHLTIGQKRPTTFFNLMTDCHTINAKHWFNEHNTNTYIEKGKYSYALKNQVFLKHPGIPALN